jgi:uncharacterized repeat protein (TIGR01451 family)
VTNVYADYGTSSFNVQSSYPGFCTGFHEDTPTVGQSFSVIADPSTIPFNNALLTNAQIRDKVARTLAVMQHPQFAPSPLPTNLNDGFYRVIADVIWYFTDNNPGLNSDTWVGADGNTYNDTDLLNWVNTNVLQPTPVMFLMPPVNTTQIEVIINPCPTCSLSLTATPTACNSNTYSVNGQFTFSNAPTSGTLTATVGSSSSTPITMTGTTTSPQNFTISGLTADGLSKTINAAFSGNATCTGSTSYNAPNACVSTCAINTPTVTPSCNNNGTPSNPADDTFTFTINATGTGVGATYKVDKISPTPSSTPFASVAYGTTSAASSAFPISGGNLTLTLTDNTTTTCNLTPVTVTAPPTCSSTVACSFTAVATTPVCNNNGTPNITTDDTYTFNVTATSVSGTSATGYNANDPLSTMGTYGTAKSFGPYAIASNGTLNITLTDKVTSGCTYAVPITAPAPCSTSVTGQPDLELTKVANKATVISGDTLVYTITLKNIGTASATGVKVKDLLPSGLTYVSSVPSQGTYTSGTGIWDVGTVAQGATLTLTITVIVN